MSAQTGMPPRAGAHAYYQEPRDSISGAVRSGRVFVETINTQRNMATVRFDPGEGMRHVVAVDTTVEEVAA